LSPNFLVGFEQAREEVIALHTHVGRHRTELALQGVLRALRWGDSDRTPETA
jgi:hypothetical protein